MAIIQKAKKIINENQELFSALEESDRTGKLRKISYKERANFTIDDDILQKFRGYCRRKKINMSAQIESLIKKFLRDEEG